MIPVSDLDEPDFRAIFGRLALKASAALVVLSLLILAAFA